MLLCSCQVGHEQQAVECRCAGKADKFEWQRQKSQKHAMVQVIKKWSNADKANSIALYNQRQSLKSMHLIIQALVRLIGQPWSNG